MDENIDKIITVAMAKSANDRYQSAELMLADIRRAMRGIDVTTKIRRIIPRRNYLVLGGAVAALITIILLGLTSFNSQAPVQSMQIPNVVGLTQSAAE